MKKIGIVTIIDYYNYGNRLQNYAVSYLFNKQLGCRAITLEGYKNHLIQGNLLGWIKEQVALQICRFPTFAEKKLSPKMIRWYNFSKWSRQWIPRQRFYSCEQIPSKINNQFDCFVSGSDQIWNYRLDNMNLEDTFLSFAENKKKNSISASFGVSNLPTEQKLYYADNLSRFSHISVREESGAQIIKELIGKDVPVLVDPVMMLSQNEWMRVEKKPRVDISRPYVLKYYLGNEEVLIDQWAEENGYIVYELMDKSKVELYSAGPGEFISLIRHADLVCSDSFHCIAFAILFSRPFIVHERHGVEDYMLSRIATLLRTFGFEDRWDYLLTPYEYLRCDFCQVNSKLKREQERFLDYVSKILEY